MPRRSGATTPKLFDKGLHTAAIPGMLGIVRPSSNYKALRKANTLSLGL